MLKVTTVTSTALLININNIVMLYVLYRKQKQMEQARAAKNVPKAGDIKDASAFLSMTTAEKVSLVVLLYY
jgi:hypothetical protein